MKHIVIHTIGKVATNSLYNTILKSCPDTQLHWTHGLLQEDYDRFFRDIGHSRGEAYWQSMCEQANQAKNVMELFRTGQVDMCFTSIRRPYEHAISSLFHHARNIFPELFEDSLELEEKKDIVAKRMEASFLKYVSKGIVPLSGPERLIVGNMTRCFTWWEMEFEKVHGIKAQDFLHQDEGIWSKRHNVVQYVMLRMEDMQRNLPKVVDMISPGATFQAVTGNVSEKRPGDWGRVYSWFRTEYTPPQAMIDYYGQHPFTRLFYPERSLVADAMA